MLALFFDMSPFFGNHGNRGGSKKNRLDPLQSAAGSMRSPTTSIKKNNHHSKRIYSFNTKEDASEAFYAHKITSGHSSTQRPTSIWKSPTAATYKVGDEVFLNTKNPVSVRSARRLDQPYEGPFRIAKVINSQFYQLKLPDELDSLHNAFHVSLLVPTPIDPLYNLSEALTPLKATDSSGKTLWTVEKVVDTKRPDGKLYYFFRWRGSAEREKMWNPPPNLLTAVITKESSVDGQIKTHKIYIILL